MLSFDDAIAIARGCLDYGGGYRGTPELEIYHEGISVVIRCLESAKKNSNDTQIVALHRLGMETNEA